MYIYIYIHAYLYIYVCVCACVCYTAESSNLAPCPVKRSTGHTHNTTTRTTPQTNNHTNDPPPSHIQQRSKVALRVLGTRSQVNTRTRLGLTRVKGSELARYIYIYIHIYCVPRSLFRG